jgi:hypothetical protein
MNHTKIICFCHRIQLKTQKLKQITPFLRLVAQVGLKQVLMAIG